VEPIPAAAIVAYFCPLLEVVVVLFLSHDLATKEMAFMDWTGCQFVHQRENFVAKLITPSDSSTFQTKYLPSF
jgi:hypothetical protein